jgi:hypothetical protein
MCYLEHWNECWRRRLWRDKDTTMSSSYPARSTEILQQFLACDSLLLAWPLITIRQHTLILVLPAGLGIFSKAFRNRAISFDTEY